MKHFIKYPNSKNSGFIPLEIARPAGPFGARASARARSLTGFTLVELIVAIAVFLSVVTVASGIFIRSFRTQRLVTDMMAIQSNSSLALEQIMREIRLGYDFEICNLGTCSPDPAGGFGDSLKFTRIRGATPVSVIYEWDQTNFGVKRTEGTSFSLLTASGVKVNKLSFYLFPRTDILAPWRISLFMNVGSRTESAPENTVNLETTVSARILPSEI
ncbi:MAG: prepilin-type N-terminal cleavage/methylation domain-containing protein [Patescibacteria group bacterium]